MALTVGLTGALIGCGGDASRIHDAAALPHSFTMCGRTWIKDALERGQSLSFIRSATGVEPVVVDPGFLTACPTGPCTADAAQSPCYTVVYVRVGDDAYIGYELSGGP